MTRKKFKDLPLKRYQRAFADLTLGEVQLLLLGLWIIGDEDRVDFQLLGIYRTMINQLSLAANAKIAANTLPPSTGSSA